MVGQVSIPVRIGVPDEVELAAVTFAAEVEAWLRTQVKPEVPVRWRPQGGGRVTVRNVEHLAELIAGLPAPGAWGVLERPIVARWTQTMRVPEGWIIEVDGGSGPDAFARRVRWAESETSGSRSTRLRCTNAAGGRAATYFASEVIPSPIDAARIMWSWLRGELPAGYGLREIVDGVD